MDKLITFKFAVVAACISLAIVAFADNNANRYQSTSITYQIQNNRSLNGAIQRALGDFMSKLSMKVSNGTIFLTGELDSSSDYEKVIMLAQSTEGVKEVNVDNLSVKENHVSLNDIYLTALVKGALIKQHLINKDPSTWSFQVETKDNQVYLSGYAASTKQKKMIIKIAKSIQGVHEVHSTLMTTKNHSS